MSEQDSTVEYRVLDKFPGYRVGSDGTVWTRRKKTRFKGTIGTVSILGNTWKQLKPGKHPKTRYRTVGLWNGHGVCTTRTVHTLVLEAFIGPCPNGMEACHSPDNNRSNNCLGNLRWDTKKSNQADRRLHGTAQLGEESPVSKLTEDAVRDIRNTYKPIPGKRTKGMKELAAKYGTTTTNIWAIATRKTWQHVP